MKQYEQLWKAIIRPNRQIYSERDIAPKVLRIGQYRVEHLQFELINNKNQKLKCSLFEPREITTKNITNQCKYPCVVYAHCNSGSRLESLIYLDVLLSKGIALFSMDFSGSGISEGQYVTLGYNEADDLEVAIKYLRQCDKISNIGLWGRSMGAVTCLRYAARDPKIVGIVSDSAFYDLKLVATDIAKKKINLPSFVIDCIFSLIKGTIQEKAQFNIDDLNLLKYIKKINIPAIFISSKQDNFVYSYHTDKIMVNYKGPKRLIQITGDHNAERSKFLFEEISNFFSYHFNKQQRLNSSRLFTTQARDNICQQKPLGDLGNIDKSQEDKDQHLSTQQIDQLNQSQYQYRQQQTLFSSIKLSNFQNKDNILFTRSSKQLKQCEQIELTSIDTENFDGIDENCNIEIKNTILKRNNPNTLSTRQIRQFNNNPSILKIKQKQFDTKICLVHTPRSDLQYL